MNSLIFFNNFGHFIVVLEEMLYLCIQIDNNHGNNTNKRNTQYYCKQWTK